MLQEIGMILEHQVLVEHLLAMVDDPIWGRFPQSVDIGKQQCDTAGRADLNPQFDQILERWMAANDRLAMLRIECGINPSASQLAYDKAALGEWITARITDLSDAARVGYAQSGRGAVYVGGPRRRMTTSLWRSSSARPVWRVQSSGSPTTTRPQRASW